MRAAHIGWLGALALGAAVLGPQAAQAADARTNSPTVLREGPGNDYRRIIVVPPGRHVDVIRCTRRQTWCEIGWRNFDGWVRGGSLDADFRYAPPPIFVEPPDFYDGPGRGHGWDHGHRPPPGMGHRPPPGGFGDNPGPGNDGPRPPRGGDNGPPPPHSGDNGNGPGNGPGPGNGQHPHRDHNQQPGAGNPPQPGNGQPPHRPRNCAPNDSSCTM